MQPKTLQQAVIHYSDINNCLDYMAHKRWPDGVVTCPTCGRKDVSFLHNQNKWQCKSAHPKRQFSAKIGTIFEDSPIPLQKWLPVVWQVCACKNGVSSYEIAKAIGVTQKTAWFMLHRIRLGMQDTATAKLPSSGGPIEVDETFIGGKARNMHLAKRRAPQMQGGKGKTIVIGMIERGGKVKARSSPSAGRNSCKDSSATALKLALP
jgi:transposase-like protein